MLEEKCKISRISVGDGFIAALGKHAQFKTDTSFGEFLYRKAFTVQDAETTHRIINHWSKMGMFCDQREDKRSWRLFSVIELIWLHILADLRGFGMSLEKIKTAYTCFMDSLMILECGIMLSLARKAICIIVFSDGHLEIVPNSDLMLNESFNPNVGSYFKIGLNACLKKVYPRKDFMPSINTFELSTDEIEILYHKRAPNIDELIVHLEDNRANRIDTKKTIIGNIGKLSEILSQEENATFETVKHNGIIQRVSIKSKHKLKKAL